jgi:hypothetical protein
MATRTDNRGKARRPFSYVTGAHNFKTGVQLRRMRQYNNAYLNGDVTYTFNGSTPTTAVPQLITYWATPYIDDAYVQQHALYVQDQWRVKNFSFQSGVAVRVRARLHAGTASAGWSLGAGARLRPGKQHSALDGSEPTARNGVGSIRQWPQRVESRPWAAINRCR